MNKILVFLALLALALGAFSCTGGAGSADAPSGENPGTPSSIQLLPAQFVAQTNSLIYLKARVFDGNGRPVANVPVTFTNLTGGSSQVLSAASARNISGKSSQVLSSASVVTDPDGFATASLFSSVAGFVTVQAELNVGSNQVRDKKTVFFSTGPLAFPSPTLTLDVDSNNNGIFDEPGLTGDFMMLQGASDNQALIRATALDAFGAPVPGVTVSFSSDDPTEVTFPLGSSASTDGNGQAFAFITIVPDVLRPITTLVNITASSGSVAANMLTLFLQPVTIQTVSVTANPATMNSGGTSDISANVTTSAGTPAPDGTTVNFTLASLGSIEPFAQTTDGIATVTYTAPTLVAGDPDAMEDITASTAGRHDTVTVTVNAPTAPPAALSVTPPSITVIGINLNVITFTIKGGTGPYTVTSSDPTKACNDAGLTGLPAANGLCIDANDTGLWTNVSSTFKVTLPAGTAAGGVILNVTDSAAPSAAVTATITIL